MRLNGTGFLEDDPPESHRALVSISAPIFTVLQGIFFYFFLKSKGWNKYIYPFMFTAFIMRLLAGFMNFIEPNDEARVGMYLGIGKHTLSIIISVFLFYLTYKVSRQFQLKPKFQIWSIVLILISITLLITIDQVFQVRFI